MDFFEEAALRLKQQLKVTEDKQAAEALGMTGNAWTMRKRRGAFPEKELRALAQQRPDIALNVDYILTGKHKRAQQVLPYNPQAAALVDQEEGVARLDGFTPSERDVVRLWRRCSLDDQALARQMLEWLAARGGLK